MFGFGKRKSEEPRNEPVKPAVDAWKDGREAEARMLLELVENMPTGIEIRRVQPKQGGNKWMVRYRNETMYYGKTLLEAFSRLWKRNERVNRRFQENIENGVEIAYRRIGSE